MKITIKKIAEMAGVHRATVDKVLHNRAGVSTEVRQRIQRLITELDYTPNPAGRVLQQQGKQYRIAAILVEVDALPFLIEGIKQGVGQQTNILVDHYTTAFRSAQEQSDLLRRVTEDGVDAIILSPINADLVRAAIDRAIDAGIPVVTINSDISGTRRSCYVGQDGIRASRIAGRLMGQILGGHGKIAIISSSITMDNNSNYVSERTRGFIAFIAEHYPAMCVAAYIESFEDPRITYQETVALLQQHPDLSGIYITCGGAAEVGRALRESGRHEAVKVLSYEDYPTILDLMEANIIDCTLASDLHRQGRLCIQTIMDHLLLRKPFASDHIFTDINILVKESLW